MSDAANKTGTGPAAGVDFASLYRRLEEAERRLRADETVSSEDRLRVLTARAEAIAAARDERKEALLEVLVFRSGGERLAVPILEVDHVLELKGLTRLPGLPPTVSGVCATRSQIIPVFDARALLELEEGMIDCTQAIVLHSRDGLFAIAVETIEGRTGIPQSSLMPPLPGPYLHVTTDGVSVLDVTRLEPAESTSRSA